MILKVNIVLVSLKNIRGVEMKLGKLFKGVIEIAALPVVAAGEVLLTGGAVILCEKDSSPTVKLLRDIEKNLDESTD